MHHENWQCLKCRHREFETDTMRATGGIFSRVFDVQNRKFTMVTCQRCHFTELYRAPSSMLGNIFDFFAGG